MEVSENDTEKEIKNKKPARKHFLIESL